VKNTEKIPYLPQIRRRIVTVIVAIVVFYIILAIYSDIGEFISNIRELEVIFVLPILLLFSAAIFTKAIRQFFFLRYLGVYLPFRQNVIIYLAGLSMLITPGGMGQIMKTHFLSKYYNQPVANTLPLVLFERYHDLLALFSFIAVISIFYNISILRLPIIAIGISLFLIMFSVRYRRILKYIEQKLPKVGPVRRLLNLASGEFERSAYVLSNKTCFVLGWSLSITAWTFEAIGIFLCFIAFELNVDFVSATVVGFSASLFGSISLIPGGAGVTELVFVHLLSSHGIEISLATAVVLFYRITGLWFSTAIGVVSLRYFFNRSSLKKSESTI
jgi:uncharacterized protein (TIRG00374 family)